MFSPTIRGLHPANLDYLARYNIRSTNHVTDYVADGILNMNYTIGVSAFRLESFVSCVICTDTLFSVFYVTAWLYSQYVQLNLILYTMP